MNLTKEALTGLSRPRIVEFEACGFKCHVRSLATKEFLRARKLPEGDQDIRLVMVSLCDAAGNRLVADDEAHVVDGLGIEFVNEVVKAVMKVNGLSKEGFGEAEKNSTTP